MGVREGVRLGMGGTLGGGGGGGSGVTWVGGTLRGGGGGGVDMRNLSKTMFLGTFWKIAT